MRRLRHSVLVALLLGATISVPATGKPTGQLPAWSEPTGSGLLSDRTGASRSALSDLAHPESPSGRYRPRFVRQTGKNCAFASAAMLLDKWTGGDIRPSQARLRTASRVPNDQGVSFATLSRAVGKVTGVDLRYSPDGGDRLTWNDLLSRLERGGAAVLGGAYSRLPRHYQRWAPSYAALGAAGSGHAVYIERYERGRGGGRVWMMDPLGRSRNYAGEWISTRALRAFAWRNSGGLVTAAATPEPAPLAGYQIGPLELDDAQALAGRQIELRLPLAIDDGWRKPNGLAVRLTWRLEEAEPDPDTWSPPAISPAPASDAFFSDEQDIMPPSTLRRLAREQSAPESDDAADRQPGVEHTALVRLKVRAGSLVGSLAAPEVPGRYRLEADLRRRDGTRFSRGPVPTLDAITVQLRGPLAAAYGNLVLPTETAHDTPITVSLQVANRGSAAWATDNAVRLIADWESPTGVAPAGSAVIELQSGDQTTVSFQAVTPSVARSATLIVRLVGPQGEDFAAFGLQPTTASIGLVVNRLQY